jgi:NAD(P)-dependent dehydrogenase (short-subunit alcohol dehydrogenase family)
LAEATTVSENDSSLVPESELVTVVTGASSGLGRALSEALSMRGRPVLLVGRNRERLLETRASCLLSGGPASKYQIVVADLTEDGAAQYVVSEALREFGAINALVNNAGLARFGPIEGADLIDWSRMITTNLIGPAALIKYAIPALRKSRGVVVNVGSIGGLLAVPGRALYGASKAALAHLTRSLARELAPEIRVNAVLPGAIETEMYEDLGLDEEAVGQLRAELTRTTPLGRMGTVHDVVPWIEMLLGPAGSWVTGSLLVVDGGRSC